MKVKLVWRRYINILKNTSSEGRWKVFIAHTGVVLNLTLSLSYFLRNLSCFCWSVPANLSVNASLLLNGNSACGKKKPQHKASGRFQPQSLKNPSFWFQLWSTVAGCIIWLLVSIYDCLSQGECLGHILNSRRSNTAAAVPSIYSWVELILLKQKKNELT